MRAERISQQLSKGEGVYVANVWACRHLKVERLFLLALSGVASSEMDRVTNTSLPLLDKTYGFGE
jgi:purine nucleoside phosphorylase